MGINVYFLMNLLLGVVFAEYQSIMADKLLSQKQLRRAMLFTAYSELDSCDAAVCGVKREDVKYLMSQYAYGSASGSEEDQFELWWQLLSDGTGARMNGFMFCSCRIMHLSVSSPTKCLILHALCRIYRF